MLRRCRRLGSTHPFTHAFTLVELLVVIGIIAVLVGVLLPALNRARRQAKQAICSNNMRQVAIALLNYTNDNKGNLIIGEVDADSTNDTYRDGWGWAAELMHQKYLSVPNYYRNPLGTNAAAAGVYVPPASALRCPEGQDYNSQIQSASPYSNNATAPTDDLHNDGYYIDGAGLANYGLGSPVIPRLDGQPLYAVACWYALNMRVAHSQYTQWPFNKTNSQGMGATPFVSYTGWKPGSGGASLKASMANPLLARKITEIRRTAQMVMLVEANSFNWCDQTDNGKGLTVVQLAARHGQKTADKQNAWSNFAFCDGHVAYLPTKPLTTQLTTTKMPLVNVTIPGLTFFLNYDK